LRTSVACSRSDDHVAQVVHTPFAIAGCGVNDGGRVGDEHDGVVAPDRLQAEVVVDPAVRQLEGLAVELELHRREDARETRRRGGRARERPVARRPRLAAAPHLPPTGVEDPLLPVRDVGRHEHEARMLRQLAERARRRPVGVPARERIRVDVLAEPVLREQPSRARRWCGCSSA
jgi:hypothetical protein